jgi:hypothetical protein
MKRSTKLLILGALIVGGYFLYKKVEQNSVAQFVEQPKRARPALVR